MSAILIMSVSGSLAATIGTPEVFCSVLFFRMFRNAVERPQRARPERLTASATDNPEGARPLLTRGVRIGIAVGLPVMGAHVSVRTTAEHTVVAGFHPAAVGGKAGP